jgi:hypothetical protein
MGAGGFALGLARPGDVHDLVELDLATLLPLGVADAVVSVRPDPEAGVRVGRQVGVKLADAVLLVLPLGPRSFRLDQDEAVGLGVGLPGREDDDINARLRRTHADLELRRTVGRGELVLPH